jgi:hypothetical protein
MKNLSFVNAKIIFVLDFSQTPSRQVVADNLLNSLPETTKCPCGKNLNGNNLGGEDLNGRELHARKAGRDKRPRSDAEICG